MRVIQTHDCIFTQIVFHVACEQVCFIARSLLSDTFNKQKFYVSDVHQHLLQKTGHSLFEYSGCAQNICINNDLQKRYIKTT